MSDEAAPSLGDVIVAALKDSPHPLTFKEVLKKLPKRPKKVDAAAYEGRITGALDDETRSGRAFSAPSGKGGAVRYWGRDERQVLREKALELAATPAEQAKLVKAAAKEVKGADLAFVEGLVQDAVTAGALFTHPPKKKGGPLIGSSPPPPPPPPPAPVNDSLIEALRSAERPLAMNELLKALPKAPAGEKAPAYRDRIEAALAEELRSGRAFSCPSGKAEAVRYWGKDERHYLREKALEVAAKPATLGALAKAVSREVKAEASYVEGLLRDMIGSEVLYTYPTKGLIASSPPPPVLPPLEQGKHPAAVRKLFEGCLKLAAAAGVGLADVLAAVRRQGEATPASSVAVPASDEAPAEPAPATLADEDIERRILDAVEREGTMSLKELRHQMPEGGRGEAFDRAVLGLEDRKLVSLSRDVDATHFGADEQAEYIREGEILFTSIAKRS